MNGLQFSFKSQKLNGARVARQDHQVAEFGKALGNHCVASCEVSRNGFALATLVLDYYTPDGKPAGWYVAFRAPGKNKGMKPLLYVWAGETLRDVIVTQGFTFKDFVQRFEQYAHIAGF